VSWGLNSAAVLLADALGAHSVFTASGKERIARVTALGGTVGVDYREAAVMDHVHATSVVASKMSHEVRMDLIQNLSAPVESPAARWTLQ
jgi:hypothetical protein